MTETVLDNELVRDYAAKGSESAFGALVRRHVDLVFATGFRLTGDAALAEEITQNVFISLARKAPALIGYETLAGWLHRSTVLETKARVRSELRRRQREQTAFEISNIEREGGSSFSALLPLLDEALLNLQENDRLALVMRFLEEKSLREVGEILGVEEDAARKRVSRALDRVGDFYRKRGFSLATAGGAPALMAASTHAAPVALAAKAAAAGISAGPAVGIFHSIAGHFMKLTKTQTAAACLCLAAVPLVWQHFASNAVARQSSALDAETAQAEQQAGRLESEIARIVGVTDKSRTANSNSSLLLHNLHTQMADASARPHYHWDEASPYARLPKSSLNNGIGLWAFQDHHGKLTSQITALLQMTGTEILKVEGAVHQLLDNYYTLEKEGMKQVEPNADDLKGGHAADQTRVFDVAYPGSNQMAQLQQNFYNQINSILGDERTGIFSNAICFRGWIAPNAYVGCGTEMTICNAAYRIRFYQPSKSDTRIPFSTKSDSGTIWATLAPNDVADVFTPDLQDWITAAQQHAQ